MNNLANIGFSHFDPDKILELFQTDWVKSIGSSRGIKKSKFYDTEGKEGVYFHTKFKWSWSGVPKTELFCFSPFYDGEIVHHVKEVKLVAEPNCIVCKSLSLWVYNDIGEEYPLFVDIPDCLSLNSVDNIKSLAISLFPKELQYWSSETEFNKYSEEAGLKASSGMFIPSGTFDPNDSSDFEPKAECVCSGIIIEKETKQNIYTKQFFHHLVIETYGGCYDVVVDKTFLSDPEVGGVIFGTFWVSGRII